LIGGALGSVDDGAADQPAERKERRDVAHDRQVLDDRGGAAERDQRDEQELGDVVHRIACVGHHGSVGG